jgi:DNA-binding NtrC family response regulator
MTIALRTRDPELQAALVRTVRGLGHTVHELGAGAISDGSVSVSAAILDDGLADFDTTLANLRARSPLAGLVVLSGRSDPRSFVDAVRLGAEVLRKPIDSRNLSRAIDTAIRGADSEVGPRVIAEDPAAVSCIEQLGRAANTDLTLVLIGECGTGKSLLARWTHAQSARRHGPRVEVSGLETGGRNGLDALRGYESNGEVRPGRLEAADGGTLVLDGIEDFSSDDQELILTLLQDGEILPRGATRPVVINARVVVTARRPLDELVAAGELIEPLMHRIGVCSIEIPPLRERSGDIRMLAQTFLSRIARELGDPEPVLDDDTMHELRSRPWPGNVRELENWMQRAVLSFAGSPVQLSSISSGLEPASMLRDGPLNLEQLERAAIARSLHQHGGVRNEAANALGISTRTLRNKIRKYNLG